MTDVEVKNDRFFVPSVIGPGRRDALVHCGKTGKGALGIFSFERPM
jgi:hypothetical protein